MKCNWTKGVVLALGLAVGFASAQQSSEPAPIVAIGKPIALSQPTTPAATISRPVPLSTQKHNEIEQTTYIGPRQPVVRGVAPSPVPQPGGTGLHGWQPGGIQGHNTGTLPYPTAVTGPVHSTPILPAPGSTIAATPGVQMPVAPGAAMPMMDCPDMCGGMGCGPSLVSGAMVDGGWPNNRWWLSAEYLLWWTKGDPTPPLVASEAAGAGANAGILPPVSNARVLYGDGPLGQQPRSGLRMFGGMWFNDEHCWGLEVGGFFLAEATNRFSDFSIGDPVVRRPIINNGVADGEVVAGLVPGVGRVAGSVDVLRRSALWGYEMNLRRGLWCGECFTLDGLLGFRALGLDESLAITENLALLDQQAVRGIIVRDKFSASNRFYGAQVGLQGELWLFDQLSLGMTTKLGLGTTWQRTNVDGSTTFLGNNGAIGTGPGGLLALPTNMGIRTQNAFTVVPEVGLTLNYQPTNWLRLFAGYNFLYWSNVVRPGGHIDPNVNPNFQPILVNGVAQPGPGGAPAVPASRFDTTDFWAHGLSFGLELRY